MDGKEERAEKLRKLIKKERGEDGKPTLSYRFAVMLM
jgi:hypothetical protein